MAAHLLLPKKVPFQLKKPYIPSKPEGAKAMTIAVGFRCKDGVVLAADTRITTGSGGKRNQTKIHTISHSPRCHVAYAADDVELAKDLVQRFQSAAKGKKAGEILQVLKAIYRASYKENYTDAPKAEKALVQFLVAIELEDRTFELHLLNGRKFFRVTDYEPLGTGADQATSIFDGWFRSGYTTTREVVFMAIYGLARTKDFVTFCGGDTQIEVLEDNMSFLSGMDYWDLTIKDAEKELRFLEDAFRPVLLRYADLSTDNEDFEEKLTEFCKSVTPRRKSRYDEYQREKEEQEEAYRKLGREEGWIEDIPEEG